MFISFNSLFVLCFSGKTKKWSFFDGIYNTVLSWICKCLICRDLLSTEDLILFQCLCIRIINKHTFCYISFYFNKHTFCYISLVYVAQAKQFAATCFQSFHGAPNFGDWQNYTWTVPSIFFKTVRTVSKSGFLLRWCTACQHVTMIYWIITYWHLTCPTPPHPTHPSSP